MGDFNLKLMLRLAWRNLWRKRGRSLLTVSAVAFVVFLTLIYFGIGGAAANSMYENLVQDAGALQVHVAGYRDLRDFDALLIANAHKVQRNLTRAVPGSSVVGVLNVAGLLEGRGRSRGVMLTGVSRPKALAEGYAAKNLAAGRLPRAQEADTIALGQGLAAALGVKLGDEVYFYAPGTRGYGAGAYKVVGLLNLPATMPAAQVSLLAAQTLAASESVSAFEIYRPGLRLEHDARTVTPLGATLRRALGKGYEVESWAQYNPGSAAYIRMLGPMMAFMTGLFFVLAGLLVTNTVYLSVIERVREFGILQALGASRRTIMGMVFTESLTLCGVGALAGALLGGLSVAKMAQGFSMGPQYSELLRASGLSPVLYASITPAQIALAVIFILCIGILAALLPAFTAARYEPIEAMRFAA